MDTALHRADLVLLTRPCDMRLFFLMYYLCVKGIYSALVWRHRYLLVLVSLVSIVFHDNAHKFFFRIHSPVAINRPSTDMGRLTHSAFLSFHHFLLTGEANDFLSLACCLLRGMGKLLL